MNRSKTDPAARKAYLIGGGIASLASAVFLIRDGLMPGENIHIFEESETMGGSLDANGSPVTGYVMRGGRMFEEHFGCTYDLLSEIPSLEDPGKSAKQDIFDFYKEASWYSRSRLIDKAGNIIDSSQMGFNNNDRFELMKLMLRPESSLGASRIDDCFNPHFFESNFWLMWCSMFSFEPWHSAIEMRRYLLRFIHHFPIISTMTGIYHTRYNQYDSMIRPIQAWLQARGVHFSRGTQISDLEFLPSKGQFTVSKIRALRNGREREVIVGGDDFVVVTNGSMTANSSIGSMTSVPVLNTDKLGASWSLWERLAGGRPEFGNPGVFISDVEKTKWVSFTVTTTLPEFREQVEKLTQNKFGRGGLITFTDSNWLLTINFHHYPAYPGQPEDACIWWGYGLFPERAGNFVQKKMSECTGEEILTEAFSQLGFQEHLPEFMEKSICIPCMMPYITSQFMPRLRSDRPLVIPPGSTNLAFVGQYCELPDDTVFTVEYSVRSAQVAVTSLLGLKRKVLPVYKGQHDIRVIIEAVKQMI